MMRHSKGRKGGGKTPVTRLSICGTSASRQSSTPGKRHHDLCFSFSAAAKDCPGGGRQDEVLYR